MHVKIKKIISKAAVMNSFCEFLHVRKKKYKKWKKVVFPYVKKRFLCPNAVFLVMTPEHENLGDHAIALAEMKLLSDIGLEYIEITNKQLKKLKEYKALNIMNGKTIIVNGGGYLGTLWFEEELLFREIITQNPKSKIFLMPNTIFYEESEWGREERTNSTRIYNAHKNLVLCAREEVSYKEMSRLYENVFLFPDMVFSLNKTKSNINRNGCIICMRSDCEKTIKQEEYDVLLGQIIEVYGENIRYRDMCVEYAVNTLDREKELEKQFESFRNAEVVLTDRLHGMIFSAITNTPCIVVNSKSPKVKGCYEWIKHLGYIKFLDETDDLKDVLKKIIDSKDVYDEKIFSNRFQELKQLLKNK